MGQMMGNLGNKDVVDPSQAKWGDLDGSEKGARLLGGGLSGLGKGMATMGGGAMPPQGGGPAIDPTQFAGPKPPLFSANNMPGLPGGQPMQLPNSKRASNPFYGGYGA